MAKAKKHKWKASEVIDLLRERYNKEGNGNSARYVFVEQVAPATGFRRRATWVDAMVFSMWPSEGLNREAFEIKVSRQDFLSEINNPYKNGWFKANSHKFWYVTAPDVVAAVDEVPEGCGWMLAQKDRLIIKKQATHRQVEDKIDAEFFAAVARAMDKERRAAINRAHHDALEMDELKLALESVQHVDAWLRKRGVVPDDCYQRPCWKILDELEDLLNRALAGDGDAKLADVLEGRVCHLRDKIGEMLIMLTPYAAELLTDIEDIGRFSRSHMKAQESFSILEDLLGKPQKYMSDMAKKARKERLRVMRELLGVAREAESRKLGSQEHGDDP